MKRHITLIIFLTFGHINMVLSQEKKQEMRKINIFGLVVDSESLNPVSGVALYNENEALLGETNKEGYFQIELKYYKKGEVEFNLKVKKKEYISLVQREHWGDIKSGSSAVFYFGLKKAGSKLEAFSQIDVNNKNITYESVYKNFESVKERVWFNNKIVEVKNENNKLFFEIENNYYLVSETGWIKLNSEHDLISIDGERVVPANQINDLINRRNVKRMTPIESQSASFEIYTR